MSVLEQSDGLRYRPLKRVDAVVVHTSNTPATVEKPIQHLVWTSRKRGVLSIGYHFVIDREGFIHAFRPHWIMGTHTPGYNHRSLGVCLMGEHTFTDHQRVALACLVGSILKEHPEAKIAKPSEVVRYKSPVDPKVDLAEILRRADLHEATPLSVMYPRRDHLSVVEPRYIPNKETL